LESVFVEYDGKLVPFFFEHIQIRNKGFAVAKFETIDTEQKAKLILKCGLYLPLEALPETEGNEFYFFEIENFKVVDEIHGEIGIVQKVIDLSGNPLIQIDFNGNEILLPKQEEFIKEIDWDNQTLHVTAPPGLINMYLGIDEEE
jgi:16S rRNA processing protein RimM